MSAVLLHHLGDLGGIIRIASFSAPALVTDHPNPLPNKIATPVCMSVRPQHDVSCRPARCTSQLARKGRFRRTLLPRKLGVARPVDSRSMMRKHNDFPSWFSGRDVRHCVVEPCDVCAVRIEVRHGCKVVDAFEILKRLAYDVEFVGIECCPECAAEDREFGGDVVAGLVQKDEFAV